MTNEESMARYMAEEFADNIDGLDLTCSLLSAKDKSHAYRLGRYDGFLAGLKVSRPKLHDLRKDPNDLPKENKRYLCRIKGFVGGGISYECYEYDTKYNIWNYASGDVIAWCEIPKFKEETNDYIFR